jgi:hypothetical protein
VTDLRRYPRRIGGARYRVDAECRSALLAEVLACALGLALIAFGITSAIVTALPLEFTEGMLAWRANALTIIPTVAWLVFLITARERLLPSVLVLGVLWLAGGLSLLILRA